MQWKGRKKIVEGVHTTEHIVTPDEIKRMTYKITYQFVPKLSAGEKERIIQFNDSLDMEDRKLSEKYPLSHLWTSALSFTPKNKEEREQYTGYHKDDDILRALYRPLPDYNTIGHYSLFISDNTPDGYISLGNNRIDLLISQMKKDIEDAIKD